jgi:hypothetical protein
VIVPLGPSDVQRHWQPRYLSFTIGWGTWFRDRWAGVGDRWDWIQTRLFALRTRSSYKGGPDLAAKAD